MFVSVHVRRRVYNNEKGDECDHVADNDAQRIDQNSNFKRRSPRKSNPGSELDVTWVMARKQPTCSYCGRPVSWLTTVNDKKIPCQPETVGFGDRTYVPGQHEPHFPHCTQKSKKKISARGMEEDLRDQRRELIALISRVVALEARLDAVEEAAPRETV